MLKCPVTPMIQSWTKRYRDLKYIYIYKFFFFLFLLKEKQVTLMCLIVGFIEKKLFALWFLFILSSLPGFKFNILFILIGIIPYSRFTGLNNILYIYILVRHSSLKLVLNITILIYRMSFVKFYLTLAYLLSWIWH